MRQVPHYTLIGNGRVAQHMCHYLTSLNISFSHWYRQANYSLQETTQNATHILLLIKDSAIEPFITAHYPELDQKMLIHFSGCYVSDRAYGAHPLMTFSTTLYPTTNYPPIPFIIEQTGPSFAELLPGLPNPHFIIPHHMKAYYHSLCVMANNFTTLLWQKFFKELTRWKIPVASGFPFLQQTLANLQQEPITALTGPLARNDQTTIDQNLQALTGDPFQAVYAAFVQAYAHSNLKIED
jgi:predicted short-subunit dehydrogenase-like oxidoreductase (DUF2520 family)